MSQHENQRKNILFFLESSLREMPNDLEISQKEDSFIQWFGKTSAIIRMLDKPRYSMELSTINNTIYSNFFPDVNSAILKLKTLLHEIVNTLRFELEVPTSIAIDTGMTFVYFDNVRKIIQEAKIELFVIDAYLDADFFSNFLTFCTPGIKIKILTSRYLDQIIPAAKSFCNEKGVVVEVRSSKAFHDRYLFIDNKKCIQSGASFKDGGNKPTIITEVTDAFDAMLSTYNKIWDESKVLEI
jgi:hypothetical protein